MSESSKVHSCTICNKNYSSKSSLCNHNKKFHKTIATESHHLVSISKQNVIIKCKYCNIEYKHKQSKSRHEKSCKKKKEATKIEELELEIKKVSRES